MSYSIDSITDNCYEGTTCLINKFEIRDEKQLNAIESSITVAKISYLQQNPIDGNFDFEHYKAIHKFIFEDLYDWAGTSRTVNISKKGTSFVAAEKIEEIATACFDRLKNMNYFENLDFEDFLDNMADFYCITNNLHPFREGNGRSQRVFLSHLAQHAGYELDFSSIDPDILMIATIKAAGGIIEPLKEALRNGLSPIEPNFDITMQF